MKNLFLVDGSGFIFRAFYALPPLTNPKGVPINAVYGYCNMILNIYTKFKPDQIIVVFDTKRKTFRNEIYKEYKSNRSEPPEELIPQFSIIREATDALQIPRVEMDGFEADDIIATYVKRAEKKGFSITIVSSDKDLMQLVNKNTKMYDSMKDNLIGIKEVKEKFGVSPDKIIDVQALAGDSIDNIPGVSGIGIKTAAELINNFKNLENVLKKANEIKQPKRREILINEKDKALISKKLVTLKCDINLNNDYEDNLFKGINQKTALEFFEKHDFKNLISRFRKKDENNSNTLNKSRENNKKKYFVIQSLKELKNLEKDIQKNKLVSVDTETNSLNVNLAKLVGISLSFEENKAFYLPFNHISDNGEKFKNLNLEECLPILKNIFEEESIIKVGHNIKYDKIILSKSGINLAPIEDTMLLSYVLDTGKLRHNLDDLAKIYFNHETIKYKDVVGTGKKEKTFNEININDAYIYAAEDADITFKLYKILKKRIISEKILSVYENIEKPLINVLSEMEMEGIKIDVKKLKNLSFVFQKKLKIIEKEIFKLAGLEFNIASPKKLGEILFDKLGFQGGKK